MGQAQTSLAAAVLDALPSAILVVDEASRVLYANARASDVLERSPAELSGADVSELFAAPAADGAQRTTRVRRANGELSTLGYTVSALIFDGAALRAISFRDIADTVRLTRERDRLLQLAAVGEATPTLLHEIRNPLAAIIAAVELLIEESTDGSTQESLHAVLTEARRISVQIDGVGAVGKALRSSRFSVIDQACRDICAIMAPRAEKAGVHLRWNVPDLPLLPLDPSTLRAVLFNLVSNALQACRRGDTVRVHVRLLDEQAKLEIWVVDTGVGMSAQVYAKCRELFFTTKRHGSGIGLALCQRAVEGAGGSLQIQSVPGAGTSVVIAIPVGREPLPESTRDPGAGKE